MAQQIDNPTIALDEKGFSDHEEKLHQVKDELADLASVLPPPGQTVETFPPYQVPFRSGRGSKRRCLGHTVALGLLEHSVVSEAQVTMAENAEDSMMANVLPQTDLGTDTPLSPPPPMRTDSMNIISSPGLRAISRRPTLSMPPSVDLQPAIVTITHTPHPSTSSGTGRVIKRKRDHVGNVPDALWGIVLDSPGEGNLHPNSAAYAELHRYRLEQDSEDASSKQPAHGTSDVHTSRRAANAGRRDADSTAQWKLRTRRGHRQASEITFAVRTRFSLTRPIANPLDYVVRRAAGRYIRSAGTHQGEAIRAIVRGTNTITLEAPVSMAEQVRDVWVTQRLICFGQGELVVYIDGSHAPFSLLDRGRSGARTAAVLEYTPSTEPSENDRLLAVNDDGSLRSHRMRDGKVMKTRRLPQAARPVAMYWLDDTFFLVKSKLGQSANAWIFTIIEAASLGLMTQIRLSHRFFSNELHDMDLQHGLLLARVGEETLRGYLWEDILAKNCQCLKRSPDELLRASDSQDTHSLVTPPRPRFQFDCYSSARWSGQLGALPYYVLQWVRDRDGAKCGVAVVSAESGRRIGVVATEIGEDEEGLEKTFVQLYRPAALDTVAPCSRVICKRPHSLSVYTIMPEEFSLQPANRFKEMEELEDESDEEEPEALLHPIVCSFGKGYHTQLIYICQTCIERTGHVSGICYACKTHCHDGHDVIDIGTRHDFRCDCGVPSKGLEACLLADEPKARINKKNKYNHNFQLRYCVCDGHDLGKFMVQCTSCDDWFHGECSGINDEDVLSMDGSVDFLCATCANKFKVADQHVRLRAKLGMFVTASANKDLQEADKKGRGRADPKADPAALPTRSRVSSEGTEDAGMGEERSSGGESEGEGTDTNQEESEPETLILEEDFRIDASDPTNPHSLAITALTNPSSGVSVRPARSRRPPPTLQGITGIDGAAEENTASMLAWAYDPTMDAIACLVGNQIYLYDAKNGAVLRKIRVVLDHEEWAHCLYIRRDAVVHVATHNSLSRAHCQIYHLSASHIPYS